MQPHLVAHTHDKVRNTGSSESAQKIKVKSTIEDIKHLYFYLKWRVLILKQTSHRHIYSKIFLQRINSYLRFIFVFKPRYHWCFSVIILFCNFKHVFFILKIDWGWPTIPFVWNRRASLGAGLSALKLGQVWKNRNSWSSYVIERYTLLLCGYITPHYQHESISKLMNILAPSRNAWIVKSGSIMYPLPQNVF